MSGWGWGKGEEARVGDVDEVGCFVLNEDVLGLTTRFEREGVVDLCPRRRASCVRLYQSLSCECSIPAHDRSRGSAEGSGIGEWVLFRLLEAKYSLLTFRM